MTPPEHLGEPAPWPCISQAHRTRSLAARLMIFGVVVLVGYFLVSRGAEWAAGVIYGALA